MKPYNKSVITITTNNEAVLAKFKEFEQI